MAKRLFVLAALFCWMALAAQPASAGGETGNGRAAASQSQVR
jgi:hypothetical protein